MSGIGLGGFQEKCMEKEKELGSEAAEGNFS